MLKVEQIFAENIKKIINEGSNDYGFDVRGHYASDNAPAHTQFITQVSETYDIGAGELPITCLRPIAIKKAIGEILWIYQDQSNDLDLLRDKYGVDWWDSWDIGDRTIGQVYGAVIKRYDLTNQLLNGLRNNPLGRQHIINLWQYQDMSKPHGLDPCAYETSWSVRPLNNRPFLDMTLIQRSSDYLVAGHINKLQYVALMMMVARHCRFELGNFCHFVQNLHIYDRHLPQAQQLLERYNEYKRYFNTVKSAHPHTPDVVLFQDKHSDCIDDVRLAQQPKLVLNPSKVEFQDIEITDFELIDYHPDRDKIDPFDIAI